MNADPGGKPMGLLGLALYDSLRCLHPVFLGRSILAVWTPYTILVLLLTGLIVAGYGLVQVMLIFIPGSFPFALLTILIKSFLLFYFLIVSGRWLGRFYGVHSHRLSWG